MVLTFRDYYIQQVNAEPIYEKVKAKLESYGLSVETGVFRTDMKVEILNDGPVTLLLDSEKIL